MSLCLSGISYKIARSPNDDSDLRAHPRSLTCVFTWHYVVVKDQNIFRRTAKTDLNLRYAYKQSCRKCHNTTLAVVGKKLKMSCSDSFSSVFASDRPRF